MISACKPCKAEDFNIGVHVATYHKTRDAGFNEYNPGAYVRVGQFVAGGYRNSYSLESYYAGYAFSYKGIDLLVGGVSGYSDPVRLMVIPSYRIPGTPFRISYLPPVPDAKIDTQALHFSLEF
jgi:hypothetical protein